MLNQARIDGLLKYMDQIGLSQMLIPQSGAGTVLCGDYTRGADRATILYVSKKNGVKLILNELTNYPKELGVDQEFHGDQDNVAEVISRYTIHDEPLGFDGEYPAKWLLSLRNSGQPVTMCWVTGRSICSGRTRTLRRWNCSGKPAA